MKREDSVGSLWERLQSSIASSKTRRRSPAPPHTVRFCLKPLPALGDEPVKSPLRPRCATQRRLRSFELCETAPSYGIPADKYSNLLLSDRQYQAHILDNEFRLLAEKLRTCAQLLETQPKSQLGLLGIEEQRIFNGKIEKAIAWVEEVVETVTSLSARLKHAGRTRPRLPKASQVDSEPEAYDDNVRLLSACAVTFNRLFGEYTRLARSDSHKTLSLEQCLTVLKRISQIRLTLSYLTEEVAAHEEAIRFNRRLLKSVSGLSSLGGLPIERAKLSPDSKCATSRPSHKASLSTKQFALQLIEHKNSARSSSPQRAETVRPDRRGVQTDRYSNVSHLFLESQLKKGSKVRRPTSKFRLMHRSRAVRVLERAANSTNPVVANSVRLLMASHAATKSSYECLLQ